ncbi:phosphoribulokinase/uridine kinase family protein [Rarobacter faecitabidus]|uniref:Phosphoribulokinase/uridine kinase family protein n=1 Tax=Rarobacter faecitabidus TaxID=13243 RepID=A0A542ZVI8_RARFA|nr:phosphoribulokinase/uridine kinase family protein [Rarobacter faecitabidus]
MLVALVGAPGAGKSYVSAALGECLQQFAELGETACMAMDGYHLSNSALDSLGLRSKKGAPETFDPAGLASLLRRVRSGEPGTIYAPDYDRDLHEPVAARFAIPPGSGIVLVEGNYLLLDGGRWAEVTRAFDVSIFLDVPGELRRARLQARHVSFGRTPQQAADWVESVDEPNALLIEASAVRATVRVDAEALAGELRHLRCAGDKTA